MTGDKGFRSSSLPSKLGSLCMVSEGERAHLNQLHAECCVSVKSALVGGEGRWAGNSLDPIF